MKWLKSGRFCGIRCTQGASEDDTEWFSGSSMTAVPGAFDEECVGGHTPRHLRNSMAHGIKRIFNAEDKTEAKRVFDGLSRNKLSILLTRFFSNIN